MSSSILPSEICRGPRWELAVKREMSLRELKMLAMANRASAIRVGCHISHSSLGREELYWRERRKIKKHARKRENSHYRKNDEEISQVKLSFFFNEWMLAFVSDWWFNLTLSLLIYR